MGNFLEPDPAARFARLELTNLFHLSSTRTRFRGSRFARESRFTALRVRVTGPTAALIRFLGRARFRCMSILATSTSLFVRISAGSEHHGCAWHLDDQSARH